MGEPFEAGHCENKEHIESDTGEFCIIGLREEPGGQREDAGSSGRSGDVAGGDGR